MPDDVLIGKCEIMERCLKRIEEEYDGKPENLRQNFTKQDSIILNVQRACEAAIDAAMYLVRLHHLGVPQESREAFDMLADKGLLPRELVDDLMRDVGFAPPTPIKEGIGRFVEWYKSYYL